MKIEKAYIFGKTLSSGQAPIPANVYFENGQFNSDLAYPNTNFSNQLITRGDYNDYNNGGGSVVFNILYPNEGDGKIHQFLGTNAGEYEISGGNIVCNLTNPSQSSSRFGTDYGAIWMPLRMPANTYTKLYMRCKLSNRVDPDSRYAINAFMARPFPEYTKYGESRYVYNWGETVDVAFDLEVNNGSWYDTFTYIGVSTGLFGHSEIQKIWFE